MKIRIRKGMASMSLPAMAAGLFLIESTGCRPDQQGIDMDSGTFASDFFVSVVAFAVDFLRALLAAFLF